MRGGLAALALSVSVLAQDATHLESGDCRLCHARIREPQVGQHPLWSNSMMARAGRDPLWQARVERERKLLPAARTLIDEKCFRCHTPTSADLGKEMAAREGVTCTVCHRITADGLGTAGSFTGGFRLNPRQELAGPHARPFQMPMLMHTTMAPVEAEHFLRPELCATCHTVITPVLDAHGNPRGQFYEQAPYLEWLASEAGGTGRTCQQCHMPSLPEEEYIAHRPPGGPFPPTRPRTPFARHEFTGGNAQVLARTGGDPEPARRRLRSAASLEASASRTDRAVVMDVQVRNRTGHKLPTGFPGRRLWLRVCAWDEAGTLVFQSGGRDAVFPQPHRTLVSSPAEVMAWEARLRGPSLLLDAGWAKDNRILPSGFDPARVRREGIDPNELRPVGVENDSNFQPGSDSVRYLLPAGTSKVLIELCFLSAPELEEDEPSVLASMEVRPGAAAVSTGRRD